MSYEQQLISELEDIIENKKITTLLQPIVSLQNGSILGYEALSRGPEGSILEMPDRLFKAAEDYGKLCGIEYLCRKKALEKAAKYNLKELLFINIDPAIMNDEKFRSGFTKDYINKYNLNPQNIIFEITERTCVNDYVTFKNSIKNYKEQGYKIAIDDTGAGYSGLIMIAETSPNFIKIDKDLIRNINEKSINMALVKSLKEFCSMSNMDIIAEGIETIEELKTLIKLGIKYGQGFLIQRPTAEIKAIDRDILNIIVNSYEATQLNNFSGMLIGSLCKSQIYVQSDTINKDVDEIFRNNDHISGIPVVDNGEIEGLIMRNSFYSALSTKYGNAVFMNRKVHLLMEKKPMVVDYDTPITAVSGQAVKRKDENLYDCIIIAKDNKYHGIVTVKELLEHATVINVEMAKSSNPLTGLPGNMVIDEKIKNFIKNKEEGYVIYFDLDNFKAYNDTYGFENGDKILKMTGEIVVQAVNSIDVKDWFVGHIGGDDFISIIKCDDIKHILDNIINIFDGKVKAYYSEKDLNRGYIICSDRKGDIEIFPILSISAAAVSTKDKKFISGKELISVLTRLKKQCKEQAYSCYLIE